MTCNFLVHALLSMEVGRKNTSLVKYVIRVRNGDDYSVDLSSDV